MPAPATDTPPASTTEIDVDDVARRIGIDRFRPIQERAISALVDGRDVLAVIPTGGGKSAIYQAAAELIPGVTVVVSPLLALQQDQMDSIMASGLGRAVAIDGSTNEGDREERLAELRDGSVEFLFVTPEILGDDEIIASLADVDISLLAVDEAHCIVTWGEGFRPDFLIIGDVRRRLGSPVTVALTGSADPRIRADVCRRLDMHDVEILMGDLERANISLSVVGADDETSAVDALVEHLRGVDGKALVYVPTRKACVEIAERLDVEGRRALPFHGGLGKDAKDAALELIRGDEGCVVVATTAFGMGIDIPDIGTVAHLDMPDSLLAYYQEVGRAGRDGAPASGAVFVSLRNRSRRAFSSGVRETTVVDCANVYVAIQNGAASRRAVIAETKLPAGRAVRAIAVLEQAGAITTRPKLGVIGASDPETIDRLCAEREEFDRSQIQAVERYRSVRQCRWAQILSSLGEPLERCGHCDVCEAQDVDPDHDTVEDGPFPVGTVVNHEKFGEGRVTSRHDDVLVVAFDQVGPKELGLSFCLDEEILDVVDLPAD